MVAGWTGPVGLAAEVVDEDELVVVVPALLLRLA
jgi:hypothetical protein